MYLAAGVPVLILSVILQTTLFSRIQILNGCADIVLLVLIAWCIQERAKGGWVWAGIAGLLVALYSGLPIFIPILVYVLVAGMALWFRRKIWRSPILVMLFLTLTATVVEDLFSALGLVMMGGRFTLSVAINRIMLPSIVLNFLFALPVYALISSLSNWLYPRMEEV
jgi:rod shape-determining protein MreD